MRYTKKVYKRITWWSKKPQKVLNLHNRAVRKINRRNGNKVKEEILELFGQYNFWQFNLSHINAFPAAITFSADDNMSLKHA